MTYKSLSLIRHADAILPSAQIRDFDRALSSQGVADALAISQRLKSRNTRFDKIYSSPALRALATAQYLAQALNYPTENIITHTTIYSEPVQQLIHLIISFLDEDCHIALIGHNPVISELVVLMSGANLGGIPTCGCIEIQFLSSHWSEIWQSPGRLLNFDYPKH